MFHILCCVLFLAGGLQEEDPNDDRVEIPMTLIEVKKTKIYSGLGPRFLAWK